MSNKKVEKKKWSIPAYKVYITIMFIIGIISILVPYYSILLIHDIFGCGHHNSGLDGFFWQMGRALGFSSLIWFIISSIQGVTMNKHAKLFRKKAKARDLHCISSFLCIALTIIHLVLLFVSEPWRSIILRTDSEHFSLTIFRGKILSGVVFAVIMSAVSILSMFARKPKFMKKIGYRRFKIIHKIMMLSTVILLFHIIFINTELWIIFGLKLR
ncbi:MAG: hypothetical protein GF383_08850 [Candidatus Lokiarchaeota archaeon]|nr:hypothetical protein [Candidatus Lokiarchaeota archaeon]MBD3340491.1 hypothetical protein [Candidatus Lokiarchaeota archaeon]